MRPWIDLHFLVGFYVIKVEMNITLKNENLSLALLCLCLIYTSFTVAQWTSEDVVSTAFKLYTVGAA